MKSIYALISVLCLFVIFPSSPYLRASDLPLYKNPEHPIHARVQDLLKQMTKEEKVGQLSTLLGWDMYEKEGSQIKTSAAFRKAINEQHIGMLWATLRADPWTKKTLQTGLSSSEAAKATNALQRYARDSTRLGIPLFLSEECPHGHMAIGATTFPTAIGQASTWNTDLIQQMADAIAAETRSVGGHSGYGPILDLAREPRWSRTEETYGEDPFLVAAMGKAMVRGFQGDSLNDKGRIASTLKHFAAYGVPEGGHNGGLVNLGPRELLQSFLPPFEEAVRNGARSVMTAYNAIDGIPCTANRWLLTDILREQWAFEGFTVSDLGSISGLQGSHHISASPAESAALALNAGLDADLSGYGYGESLLQALKDEKVSEGQLDTAVARVLRLKFELGLFDRPLVDESAPETLVHNKAHIELARQVARESIVLLKNKDNALPLSSNLSSVAVIGPNADNPYNQLGDYTAPQHEGKVVTVLKGIQEYLGSGTKIRYVKGCAIRDTTEQDIASAVEAAKASDVAIVVLGGSSARDFKTSYQETGAANVDPASVSDMESGEGFDRATLDLMGKQLELLKAVQATGKPVILVLIKGRPLNLNWAEEHVPAIVDSWYPGQEGGHAIAEVLFGAYNPAGRLPISVPRSAGQLPVYYNYKSPVKHEYVEMDSKPLYSFGYGLSYTSFEYSTPRIVDEQIGADSIRVNLSFRLKNTGKFDGDEVVQVYVRDATASVTTPLIQLAAFKRIHLGKGEEKEVRLQLNERNLSLVNASLNRVVEEGKFKFFIGSSSTQLPLEMDWTLEHDVYLDRNSSGE